MVDLNGRLAGRVLVGVLAVAALAAVIPGFMKPATTPSGSPAKALPVRPENTQPTILHAVEGYDGTPSPLPGGPNRSTGFPDSPQATSAALTTIEDPDLR